MHARRLPETHTHRTPRRRAIELVLPTAAWLIAAPPSKSARTHTKCPLWLAIISGVAPIVCHATALTPKPSRPQAWPHHRIDTYAAAHSRDAPHDLKYGIGSITSRPSPRTHTIPAHDTNQLRTHACTQAPMKPRAHSPLQCRAIELVLLTSAWLINAPPSNSARTHSTCPFWLAMYSGLDPIICHATRHSQRNRHALMPGLTTVLTRLLQLIIAMLPMT